MAEDLGLLRKRPVVSVVVPTRDRADLLSDALGSLLAQDYQADRLEIVVVDDGSSDGTAEGVARVRERQAAPEVRLIRQGPKNQNTARNRGISEAKGSLIAFFDDDEMAPPDWLSGLVAASARHPDAACLGGPYRVRFEGRPPRLCSRHWPGEGGFDLGPLERPVPDVAAGNMIVRRTAFDLVGMFDETLQGHGDETEWMGRLIGSGREIVYVPSAWVWHRRLRRDLGLSSRLRKAFVIGRQDARYHARVGTTDPIREMKRVPRVLGHALRRRCSYGLVETALAVGYATEASFPRER